MSYWLTVQWITRPNQLRPTFLTGPSACCSSFYSVSHKIDHLIIPAVHWEVLVCSNRCYFPSHNQRKTHKKWKIMALQGRKAVQSGRRVPTTVPYTKLHGVTQYPHSGQWRPHTKNMSCFWPSWTRLVNLATGIFRLAVYLWHLMQTLGPRIYYNRKIIKAVPKPVTVTRLATRSTKKSFYPMRQPEDTICKHLCLKRRNGAVLILKWQAPSRRSGLRYPTEIFRYYFFLLSARWESF